MSTLHPIQQAQFLKNQYQLKLRQNRFVVDQPMLALSQKAIGLLADTQHKQLAIELAFDHALLLYFNHQHQKAFEHFLQFYQDTKNMKNVKINTLCLNYLAVCARHLGKVEQCQQFAEQTIIEGKKAQLNDYIGAATANLAWVSYKKTTTEKAEVHQSDDKKYQEDIDSQLSQAAQLWQNSMYPMQWQGLLLQLDKHCTNKDMNNEKCLSKTDATLNTIINTLLEPSQQCLPALISVPLQQALEMQSSKTSLQSNNNPFHLRLQQVIQNAKLLGYL